LDPSYPPQSLRSWIREEDRNKVTPERKTIYVAAPPDVDPNVDFIRNWSQPRQKALRSTISQPHVQDVLSYIEAYYHGLPVKLLPSSKLRFTAGVDDLDTELKLKTNETQRYIVGLDTHTSSGFVGIHSRPPSNGDFTHQLNLNDLLDAAIIALPEDAYALLLLVEHDLYEDDDDEFVCGRAYGGSRVAVISTARYHPLLDGKQGIDRGHAWPASHCKTYLQSCCASSEPVTRQGKKKTQKKDVEMEKAPPELVPASSGGRELFLPLHAAVSAHSNLPSLNSSPSAELLSGLWLGRVCRTASHELGHCFGMDHCVYYACGMQGSASIIEDARQPPYLCPVDLAKVLRATGTGEKERYEALLSFCDKQKDIHIFAGYGAWIRGRLTEMESLSL
jgi:archaemetzincin